MFMTKNVFTILDLCFPLYATESFLRGTAAVA
jgi:hypothetical protein